MDKLEILNSLNEFKDRLCGEVAEAFATRGNAYGSDRFVTWRRKFSKFLDESLPGESSTLNAKLTHFVYSMNRGESDYQRFWRVDGENMLAYIDSLILDIDNDNDNDNDNDEYEYDYDLKEMHSVIPTPTISQEKKAKNKVFIVHGHDGEAKEKTARFIEKLGFQAIILHEQASRGMTIIEKIEEYSNEVGFGIVLYTPDDLGNVKIEAENSILHSRVRQNVVFEHGFLIGKIGRKNVAPLVDGAIELPNDISGIVYISDKDWQLDIAKEMKMAGYEIDFNKLI